MRQCGYGAERLRIMLDGSVDRVLCLAEVQVFGFIYDFDIRIGKIFTFPESSIKRIAFFQELDEAQRTSIDSQNDPDSSQIKNLSNGQDVLSTKKCLEQCGISINGSKNSYQVRGGKFADPVKDLDCQNSGTTVRLLTGLLAGKNINARLIGDESLSKRPMERIVKPLSKMGLQIKSKDGKLPISIKDSRINGIDYKNTMSSAQVKSAVLLCGLGTTDTTSYYEPIKSRNHTEIMLKNIGVDIEHNNGKIILRNSNYLIKG